MTTGGDEDFSTNGLNKSGKADIIKMKRPDIYWGKSRTGKTSGGIGRTVEWAWAKTGKPSRAIYAPGEGWENIQDLVDAGKLLPFMVSPARKFPLEDFQKLSQGWWPKDINDPMSPLIPPKENGLLDNAFGGWFWEGMSSTAAYLMTNTTTRTDIHIPETPKDSFVKDGETRWGFSGRAHYGWIQKRIEEWVKTSAYIPTPYKAWSALEAQGEQDNKRPVRGPGVIGQAATADCPAWFNRMFHFTFESKLQEMLDPTDKTRKISVNVSHRLMYLQPHIEANDPFKVECLADARVPIALADKMPVVMAPDMYKFHELLEQLLKESAARAAAGNVTTVSK